MGKIRKTLKRERIWFIAQRQSKQMGTTRQPRQQQPERTIGEERRRPEHLGQKDAPHPHHLS